MSVAVVAYMPGDLREVWVEYDAGEHHIGNALVVFPCRVLVPKTQRMFQGGWLDEEVHVSRAEEAVTVLVPRPRSWLGRIVDAVRALELVSTAEIGR